MRTSQVAAGRRQLPCTATVRLMTVPQQPHNPSFLSTLDSCMGYNIRTSHLVYVIGETTSQASIIAKGMQTSWTKMLQLL